MVWAPRPVTSVLGDIWACGLGVGGRLGLGVWGGWSGIPEGAAGYSSSRKGCMGNVGMFASFKKETIWCTE